MEEEEETVCFADPTRFITDPDFCYQEFARREEDHFQVFRVQVGLVYLSLSVFYLIIWLVNILFWTIFKILQDYSWEDHGFSLVNRLYSDIGHLLDDRFRSVTSLPSLHSPDLKRAIWNYIQCVIGIRWAAVCLIPTSSSSSPPGCRIEHVWLRRYDDYDYGEVNQLLPRDLKPYIKAVACFPDATKTPVCPLTASERVRPPALDSRPFSPAPVLIYTSASLRYTWIYWSWRPGCRASCCTPWEPSPSTWSPKCSERPDWKGSSGTERCRKTRLEDGDWWRSALQTLWGTQSSIVHSCASWMSVLCSHLMHLHHSMPQPTSRPSLQTLEDTVQLLFYYYRSGFTLYLFVLSVRACSFLAAFHSPNTLLLLSDQPPPTSALPPTPQINTFSTSLNECQWETWVGLFLRTIPDCWIAKDAVCLFFFLHL